MPQPGSSRATRSAYARSSNCGAQAQFRRNRWSTRPALPAPEDPPAQSVPADDGCRLHVDHGIAPIEQSGEQGKADAGRAIQAPGFDTTLDITGELFAKDQVLSADRSGRAQERDDQPQDVPGYCDDRSRQLQHVLIMPESGGRCRRWTRKLSPRELLRSTRGSRRCDSVDESAPIPSSPSPQTDRTLSRPTTG